MMAIFGLHTCAVTPPKARLISGPMHARHLGGVSITGGTGGNISLDSYFTPTSLEPDELPSHTYAASGTTEVPRRSRTFTSTVRRPSISLKRSISRLRSGSSSHGSEGHKRSQSDNRPITMATKSDQAVPHLQQTTKRKASPISSSLVEGLVQDDSSLISRSNLPGSRRDAVPAPPPKDYPHGDSNIPSRLMSACSVGTDYERVPEKTRVEAAPPLPVRPKRADSGAAIDFDNIGAYGNPKSFKDIMAMQNYEDRMEMYEKTREYWANAEHGLAEWTGRSGGPRTVQLRREHRWR